MTNKTLLFASEMTRGWGAYAIAQGLRRLGWDVREADTGRFFPSWRSLPLRAIRRALDRNAGVKARAARDLGITRQALQQKLRRLGVLV